MPSNCPISVGLSLGGVCALHPTHRILAHPKLVVKSIVKDQKSSVIPCERTSRHVPEPPLTPSPAESAAGFFQTVSLTARLNLKEANTVRSTPFHPGPLPHTFTVQPHLPPELIATRNYSASRGDHSDWTTKRWQHLIGRKLE